jgi:DNA-binding NarL/FixJ family response regulator
MSTRTLRVLVVDDHEIVRRNICQLLVSQADIEVICEAANGQEAVLRAREHRPDLVLMDVTMPTMNGLEPARIIKQELPSIRVLMVSQHDSPQFMREALAVGASGYIAKSAVGRDLIPQLRNLQYPNSTGKSGSWIASYLSEGGARRAQNSQVSNLEQLLEASHDNILGGSDLRWSVVLKAQSFVEIPGTFVYPEVACTYLISFLKISSP